MVLSFKHVVPAAALALSLTACEKPDQKDSLNKSSGSRATFVVDTAKGEGQPVQVDKNNRWQVPNSASFSFRVCLKDRATRENLRGQRFMIEKDEDKGQITPEDASDVDGCIKWQEEHPFNYFAGRSSRIPLKRYIVGQGIQSGRVEVNLAINPWAVGNQARDRGEAVVYLRDQILPKGQLVEPKMAFQAMAGDNSGGAEIWIRKVDVNSIRRQSYSDGSVIDLTFEIEPKLKVQDVNGEVAYLELYSGEFDVVAHLIATDTGGGQSDKVLLTPVQLAGSAKIEDRHLLISTRTSLERRVPYGNIELALKLIPKNTGSLTRIKDYEGIFELGAVNELSRSPRGLLTEDCRKSTETPNKKCSVAEALSSTKNFEALKETGEALVNEPLIFSNLKLRFATVQPGETATQRTVLYSATTCIKDRWTGQDMAEVMFQIDYLDEHGNIEPGLSQVRHTNEEGCLSWDSTIFHKYYEPERLIWKNIRITLANPATDKTGVSSANQKRLQKQLKFALNPWDDKFTFGWDVREFSPQFIQNIQKKKKIPSRFFLSHFGYHTVRFLYNIDRFMELEVKKTVLMELEPRVLRYSGIINARKQTEALRDGIYLLKVGIQKDFLDPADRERHFKNKKEEIPSAMIEELGGPVSRKEFITTQSQLVRVVDGQIIHPVELTMRDLRLMRIRANFMIQLETVDERLVTGNHVLRERYRAVLENLARDREEKAEIAQLPEVEREQRLKQEAEERRAKFENVFYVLKERLEAGRFGLTGFDLSSDKQIVKALEDADVKEPFLSALETNDFTEVKFPLSEDFDLNSFIEKDSGLASRSFVGPVIFLSNAYSDSVRATDNLDEARCDEPIEPALKEKGLASVSSGPNDFKWEEFKLFANSEKQSNVARQNNAYRFSKYYGSLRHLCSKSVDDLIAREKETVKFYKENMPLMASIFNFVSLYNLEFLTFGKEKLRKLDLACEGSGEDCMRETNELTLSKDEALKATNADLEYRLQAPTQGWATSEKDRVREGLNSTQLADALFSKFSERSQQHAVCSLLASRAADRLEATNFDDRYQGWWSKQLAKLGGDRKYVGGSFYRTCMESYKGGEKPVFFEDRLRVKETGKYTFLGGLQINLNVAESFSMGRSDSWGYSVKPTDMLDGTMIIGAGAVGFMIGGPAGMAIGAGGAVALERIADLIKPLSLSSGHSLSSGDGTSVSQSTYLVAQIARFNIEIPTYEYCRVIRFDPEFATKVGNSFGIADKFRELIARGLFVCSGRDSVRPIKVEEGYFYFTQHFTEGDMLDQADIYNHPWLLGLRGVREFATFVDKTNAQEVVNFKNFYKGAVAPEKRHIGWPLVHMENTYRKMIPSFPGLYTLVNTDEKTPTFPLAERMSRVDDDLNAEIHCQLNPQGSCAEKSNAPVMQ